MDTDYSFWLCTVKNDEVLTDRLPLEMSEDFTRVRNGASTVSFELHLNARGVPSDIMSMLKPLEVYVVVVSDALSQPIIAYYLTDTPTTGDGVVRFEGTTFEGLISDYAYVPDLRFDNKDVVSEIGKTIGLSQEVGGAGMGLTAIAPPSGVTRTKYYAAHETTTVASALTALGLVWNIHVRWADEAKTKFKKVLELALPTPVATPPTLFFELGRNIATFDYAAPMSGGTYATRLTVRGDGTGQTRAESATAVDAAAELRMHKRHIYLDIQGLTNTSDCNAYLQQVKANYFVRKDAVTLTAIATNAVRFEDIHNMHAVASVDIDSKALTFTETCIFGGWTLGSSLRTFTPTLIKLVDGVIKFPTSVDPAIAGKEPSAGKSDPFKNGVYIPKPGGGGFGISPTNGFGDFDPNGGFKPIGGGGAAIREEKVDSPPDANGILTIQSGGTRVLNVTGRTMSSGDTIYTGKVSNPSEEGEAEVVALGKGRLVDGSIDDFGSSWLSAGYPHDTARVGLGLGRHIFEDAQQSVGFGTRTLVVAPDTYDEQSVSTRKIQAWDPTGAVANLLNPPPISGWTAIPNSISTKNGILYQWFGNPASPTVPKLPQPFRYDNIAKKWVQIPGLPAAQSFTDGLWTERSVRCMPDSYPAVAIIKSELMPRLNAGSSSGYWYGAVQIWTWTGAQWSTSPWLEVRSGLVGNSTLTGLDVLIKHNGRHYYIMPGYRNGSGSSSTAQDGRIYYGQAASVDGVPTSISDQYVGRADGDMGGALNFGYGVACEVSAFDGRLYASLGEAYAPSYGFKGNILRSRMPNGIVKDSDIFPPRVGIPEQGVVGSGVTIQWTSSLHVGGERYICHLGIPQFSSTGANLGAATAITDHQARYGVASTNTVLVQPVAVGKTTQGDQMESLGYPTLQPDGAVISHIEGSPAKPRTASRRAYRFSF